MAWLTAVSVLSMVTEAYAYYCGDNIFCHAPYKCCDLKKGCCYDSMLHTSKHFRLQIWNMWYFWFLIIFMMMSCFGGCGYYRRRRLAMLTRGASPQPARPATTVLGPTQRRSRTRRQEPMGRHLHSFVYNGPGFHQPQPVSNLPPAYAEVISQPALYPLNKVELPPYPGNDKPDGSQFPFAHQGSTVLPQHETTLPPPYSEHQYDSPQPPVIHPPVPPPTPHSSDSSQPIISQENVASPPSVPLEPVPEPAANNTNQH